MVLRGHSSSFSPEFYVLLARMPKADECFKRREEIGQDFKRQSLIFTYFPYHLMFLTHIDTILTANSVLLTKIGPTSEEGDHFRK